METILSHLKLKPKDLSDTTYSFIFILHFSDHQPSGPEPQIVPEWDSCLHNEASPGPQL